MEKGIWSWHSECRNDGGVQLVGIERQLFVGRTTAEGRVHVYPPVIPHRCRCCPKRVALARPKKKNQGNNREEVSREM